MARKAARKTSADDRIEQRTGEIGRDLCDRLSRRGPSIFDGRWWEDRLLSWATDDEAIRNQMLRFVDVLPMLRDHTAITRHLSEYFEDIRSHLPGAARLGLELSSGNVILSRALAFNARSHVARMARRFIAGHELDDILSSVRRLRRARCAVAVSPIAGGVYSDRDANRYQQRCLQLIEGVVPAVEDWPDDAMLDTDDRGTIPRVHVVVRVSSLDTAFTPASAEKLIQRTVERLRPVLRSAMLHGAFVQFDSERRWSQHLAMTVVQRILMEPEFREFAQCGVSIRASDLDAGEQLQAWHRFAGRRGVALSVRLVEGTDRETDARVAERNCWPCPVHTRQGQVESSFEALTRLLFEHHVQLRPILATVNFRTLAFARAVAEDRQLPVGSCEIQMPYGVGEERAQLCVELGQRVRILAPCGSLFVGMAVLARHMLENTCSQTMLSLRLPDAASLENLLMKPAQHAATQPVVEIGNSLDWINEPLSDFSLESTRSAMSEALAAVREQFGETYPLIIDGKSCDSRTSIVSRNPSKRAEIIGRVASASVDQATDAIDAARRAFGLWSATAVDTRAEYLDLIAAELRERRFELAAWIILETGRPWTDADADVADAIDYCVYYAREMRRRSAPQRNDVAGEENSYCYRPHGICVAVASWNSPLASLVGMTAAAIVAGNTVVMKPSEKASVIAARFMEIVRNSHLPDGVVNFLPGAGEDIGTTLVSHPDVDVIAFVGSHEVGLEINRLAADTDKRQRGLRHVVAEMRGRNAIIVDDDADLDDAVAGVVQSAFGFAGQQSAACSRVIVLAGVYEQFSDRLVESVRSLTVGVAEDPATVVGPVIDEDSRDRILDVLKRIDPESGAVAVACSDLSALAKQGTFVAPHVVLNADATSSLAQAELSGPVLCVIRAKNIDDALQIANGTRYALAGGIYSRSPVNLNRARTEFEVGNLSLNRELTGFRVGRQPFGGFRMSGSGAKTGGPDYLLEFLIPMSISENTTRRGFTRSRKK